MAPAKTDPTVRFWRHVDVRKPDECWPWIGARGSNGYGHFVERCWPYHDRRQWLAHRFAFKLAHGFAPILVRHRCDNPACCNSAHLLQGTNKENTADAVARGRMARGARHGRVKLTEDEVLAIRLASESYRVLAARFDISTSQVSRIRTKKRWSHA